MIWRMDRETSSEAEARLTRLERDVREMRTALARNTAALEALTAETRNQTGKLAAWVEDTSRATQDIVQSRIWRFLVSVGGVLLGMGNIARRTAPAPPAEPVDESYRRWISEFEWRDETAIRQRLDRFTNRPLISVLVPVFDAHPEDLDRTLGSLAAQSYPAWEVCLASSGPRRRRLFASTPQTLRTAWSQPNPFESAMTLAQGEFIALLPPGAAMAPDALFYAVELLAREPATDVVYSDEDRIDTFGNRSEPFFKPSWSPDLLLSMNYVGGLLLVRRSLALQAGGHDAYDLLLRVTAATSRVRHVPRVLYHGPAGRVVNVEMERRSLDDHLHRAHAGAWSEPDPESGRWRVRYPPPLDGCASILIPSGGNVDLLEANLAELAAKTDYPQYEIVVSDNSSGEAVERFVRGWNAGARPVRYLDERHRPFNFAAICNRAARSCDSPYLLFLNDDTRVIGPAWLRAMIELGARPEVGAVGARLLFPDGTIQHAGITLGLYGRCGHLFKGLDAASAHYFGIDRAIRNVSAVTGACLLVRADVFAEVGGFDEEHFPVDHNDVDLCLRIGAKGYRVLYTPYAQLCHYESLSKGTIDHRAYPAELQEFARRWADRIRDDPYYNPNLTRLRVDCSPRKQGE